MNKSEGKSALQLYRESLTPAEKDELLVVARQAAQRKRELRDANAHLIKTEYLDSNLWATLASKHGVRMPHQSDKTSASVIRKYLKRAGVSVDAFNAYYTSMKYFVENNPRWSAFATAGIILELKEMAEFH